jgi:hypothetical protein
MAENSVARTGRYAKLTPSNQEGRMRRSFIVAGAALAAIAAPAVAVGLDDLAKAVLGGSSVLKKAETKCGADAKLTPGDNLTIDNAVAAVRKSLAPSQFSLIDSTMRADADKQAESTTFCPETKKKKKSILSKIGKAGKKLISGKLLGI